MKVARFHIRVMIYIWYPFISCCGAGVTYDFARAYSYVHFD